MYNTNRNKKRIWQRYLYKWIDKEGDGKKIKAGKFHHILRSIKMTFF